MRKGRQMGCLGRWALVMGALLLVASATCLMLGSQADGVRIPIEQPGDASSEKTPPGEAPPADASAPAQAAGMPESLSFTSYEDYARWRADREPAYAETVKNYSDTLDVFQKDQVFESYRATFWKPAPGKTKGGEDNTISSAQAAWLASKADFLESLHRLSRCRPLPCLPLRERQALQRDGGNKSVWPDNRFLITGVRLLISEGRWHWQEHDDGGAGRAFRDAYRLATLFGDDGLGLPWQTMALYQANQAARPWILDPRTPVPELSQMADLLDQLDGDALSPDKVYRFLSAQYLLLRDQIIRQLNASTWRDPVYGLDNIFRSEAYRWGIPLIDREQIPRPDVLASRAVRAMYRRHEMPRMFKALDEETTAWIEATKGPYPQYFARLKQYADEERQNNKDHYLRNMAPDRYENAVELIHTLKLETDCRLIRLAAHWRVNSQETRARRNEEMAGQPNHLWRDPFTGKPFGLDEGTTCTLIYSVGPDLEDQKGKIAFDAQGMGNIKNTMRGLTGDLAIELPR